MALRPCFALPLQSAGFVLGTAMPLPAPVNIVGSGKVGKTCFNGSPTSNSYGHFDTAALIVKCKNKK